MPGKSTASRDRQPAFVGVVYAGDAQSAIAVAIEEHRYHRLTTSGSLPGRAKAGWPTNRAWSEERTDGPALRGRPEFLQGRAVDEGPATRAPSPVRRQQS